MENGGKSREQENVCRGTPLSSRLRGDVGVGEKQADSENYSGVRLTSILMGRR